MNEMISVIVPVYNVERYLKTCVDSICKQTYKNLEIILVDDGSTDDSGKLCDKFAECDNRISVIHKQNGGLSDARNVGLEKAAGEYISFIDSDDYISEDMLEKLLKNLKDHSADVSACGYTMVYPGNSVDICEGRDLQIFSSEEAFRVLLHKNNIGVIACNKLYKKGLFQTIRYPLGKHFEDINTTYKIIAASSKIVYDPIPLYYYMQREDSINGQNFKRKQFNDKNYDMEAATDELLSFVNEHNNFASPDIYIGCLDYYLRVLNQEILYSIFNKRIYEKAKHIVKIIRKDAIKADYIGRTKKYQILIFDRCFPAYKILIRRLKR